MQVECSHCWLLDISRANLHIQPSRYGCWRESKFTGYDLVIALILHERGITLAVACQ